MTHVHVDNEAMLGLKKSEAGSDLAQVRKKKEPIKKQEETEGWNGIEA